MAVPTFTLVGGDKTPAGTSLTNATGTLTFILTETLVDTTDDVRVHPVPIVVTLASGTFSQVLACTSGSLLAPTGVRYKVKERITGARERDYYIAVPDTYAGQTVNLADLVPVPGTPQATWTIPDLTAEQARDLIGTTLVAGQGITKTVDDAGDTVTIAAEVTQAELDTEATARANAITALSGTYVALLDKPITSITWNTDGTPQSVAYVGGPTISYTYNADGSVATSSDGTTTRTFTYNGDGTLASVA